MIKNDHDKDKRYRSGSQAPKPDLYRTWKKSYREIWEAIEAQLRGERFPTGPINISEISRRTGYSRALIGRAISLFKRCHLLRLIRRNSDRPSIYHLNWDFSIRCNPLKNPLKKRRETSEMTGAVRRWQPLAMKLIRERLEELSLEWMTPVFGKLIWKQGLERDEARDLLKHLGELVWLGRRFSSLTRQAFAYAYKAIKKLLARFRRWRARERSWREEGIRREEAKRSWREAIANGMPSLSDFNSIGAWAKAMDEWTERIQGRVGYSIADHEGTSSTGDGAAGAEALSAGWLSLFKEGARSGFV
jgi:hypothetical protein